MKEKNRETCEVIIPKGYEIDEILNMDESDFRDEKPILTEEVKISFE